MNQQSQTAALREAIALLPSAAELARRCGVTPQALTGWLRVGVPAERVLAVETATGGKVHRSRLRPDIYPPEEAAA